MFARKSRRDVFALNQYSVLAGVPRLNLRGPMVLPCAQSSPACLRTMSGTLSLGITSWKPASLPVDASPPPAQSFRIYRNCMQSLLQRNIAWDVRPAACKEFALGRTLRVWENRVVVERGLSVLGNRSVQRLTPGLLQPSLGRNDNQIAGSW